MACSCLFLNACFGLIYCPVYCMGANKQHQLTLSGYKLVNFYITHFMIHKLHTSFHDSQITLCRNMFSPSGCSKCVRRIYRATRVASVCTFKWARCTYQVAKLYLAISYVRVQYCTFKGAASVTRVYTFNGAILRH